MSRLTAPAAGVRDVVMPKHGPHPADDEALGDVHSSA